MMVIISADITLSTTDYSGRDLDDFIEYDVNEYSFLDFSSVRGHIQFIPTAIDPKTILLDIKIALEGPLVQGILSAILYDLSKYLLNAVSKLAKRKRKILPVQANMEFIDKNKSVSEIFLETDTRKLNKELESLKRVIGNTEKLDLSNVDILYCEETGKWTINERRIRIESGKN